MNIFVDVVTVLGLGYFVAVNSVYIGLDIVALTLIPSHMKRLALASLPHQLSELDPPISVLVPAYNEGAGIVSSVRAMLQLRYPSFEVVVINDGSRDNTLEQLIEEFGLEEVPFAYVEQVRATFPRAFYASRAYPNLLVIDKENGGKGDSLNVGINASTHPLFCGVDADSIMEPEALRRVAQAFLADRNTVASGGTIRVANGCEIDQGVMVRKGVSKKLLPRLQTVEYLRAFLFGRFGWSPANALLIISGAFGLFRRDVVVEVGGYSNDSIGEDMELVVRLHTFLRLNRRPYKISFVPDPICWTEAPEDMRTLRRQRIRWQRGLLESLTRNRRLALGRRTGAAGWLAWPFHFVLEGLGPIIEVLGYVVTVFAWVTGIISTTAFVAFLAVAIGLGLFLSVSGVLLEEISFRIYPSTRQTLSLISAAIVENFGYRQITAAWRAFGVLQFLFKRRGAKWGEMKRSGLGDIAR